MSIPENAVQVSYGDRVKLVLASRADVYADAGWDVEHGDVPADPEPVAEDGDSPVDEVDGALLGDTPENDSEEESI